MPFYNALQNALFQNALFKKGIMNKSILSSGIGGHFERAYVKCPFALSTMPKDKGYRRAFLRGQKGISTK
jgi:hypothetical protein